MARSAAVFATIAHTLTSPSEAATVLGCSEPDEVEVVHAAQGDGVAGLLWAALDGVTGPGAAVRARLEQGSRAALLREVFVGKELQRVLGAIAGTGARAVVIKGSALAYTAYPEPWLRPRTDTDLLTDKDEMPRVSAALESCGYSRSDALSSGSLVSHQLAFERTDERGLHHVIDVHWKVVNPQQLADTLTFTEIWRDAQAAPLLGPDARVPSQVDSLVLACVHRLAHHQGQDRLIWLYDLKLLADTFEARHWETFVQRVTERAVAGVCLDGLRKARDLLAAPLPEGVEAALTRAAPVEPSRHYVEGPVHRRDVLASDLAVLPSWRARLRLLREHAFPPAAFVLQRYGVANRAYLPLLYLHRLVTGGYRWITRRT